MKLGYLLVTSALVGFQLSDPSAAYAQAAPNVPAEGQTTPTGEVEVPVDANGEQAAGNTIVVTGSRIKRPEFSGVLPGVQVDREAIIWTACRPTHATSAASVSPPSSTS